MTKDSAQEKRQWFDRFDLVLPAHPGDPRYSVAVNGTPLHGVRRITIHSQFDDVTTVTIECMGDVRMMVEGVGDLSIIDLKCAAESRRMMTGEATGPVRGILEESAQAGGDDGE